MFVLHPREAVRGEPCTRLRAVDGMFRCGLYLDETDPERREFIRLATGMDESFGCDCVIGERDQIRRELLGDAAHHYAEKRGNRMAELLPRMHASRLVKL